MKTYYGIVGAFWLFLAVLVAIGEVTLWPILAAILCAEFGVSRMMKAFRS